MLMPVGSWGLHADWWELLPMTLPLLVLLLRAWRFLQPTLQWLRQWLFSRVACLPNNCSFQEVVIEYDALNIIHSINSVYLSCAWELLLILSRAHEVGMTFQACFWSWVPRSINMAEDYVTTHHSHEMCDLGWAKRSPSPLCGYLEQGWPFLSSSVINLWGFLVG